MSDGTFHYCIHCFNFLLCLKTKNPLFTQKCVITIKEHLCSNKSSGICTKANQFAVNFHPILLQYSCRVLGMVLFYWFSTQTTSYVTSSAHIIKLFFLQSILTIFNFNSNCHKSGLNQIQTSLWSRAYAQS